jgi:hypothetical protein
MMGHLSIFIENNFDIFIKTIVLKLSPVFFFGWGEGVCVKCVSHFIIYLQQTNFFRLS